MRRTLLIATVLVCPVLWLGVQAQEKTDDVTLQVVKYEGLKAEILKNRGKVVMVDFWGDFCAPCKAKFPHVVEMHRKLANKGLAVISVALDSLTEEEPSVVKGKVLNFLKKQKATFTNLLLDETDEFWIKKLRIAGPPSVYVFNRQGKWTHLTAQEMDDDPQRLDRLVEELLAEKN